VPQQRIVVVAALTPKASPTFKLSSVRKNLFSRTCLPQADEVRDLLFAPGHGSTMHRWAFFFI
jgi:hypothetical protein